MAYNDEGTALAGMGADFRDLNNDGLPDIWTEITVKDLGYTGYEAEEILRKRYNVQVELADLFNCVALITIGTTGKAADELVYAVQELAREDRPVDIFSPSGVLQRRLKTGTYQLPKIPPMRLSPREAFLAPTSSSRSNKARDASAPR